jgi:hypothetical protein
MSTWQVMICCAASKAAGLHLLGSGCLERHASNLAHSALAASDAREIRLRARGVGELGDVSCSAAVICVRNSVTIDGRTSIARPLAMMEDDEAYNIYFRFLPKA